MYKSRFIKVVAFVGLAAAYSGSGASAYASNVLIHHSVSTNVVEAQEYFDLGLQAFLGFNRYAAAKEFKLAAKSDPTLAMAYWGQAITSSGNVNIRATASDIAEGKANINLAIASSATSSDEEQKIIVATSLLFDDKSTRQDQIKSYADSMSAIHDQFPTDTMVADLFALAEMQINPWEWYRDGQPLPSTSRAIAALRDVLKVAPDDIGALHLLVHLGEESPDPGDFSPEADKIVNLPLTADLGHLAHMAAHIYLQTGAYVSAIKACRREVGLDREYVTANGPESASEYTVHNEFTLLQALRQVGDFEKSRSVVRSTYTEGFKVPGLFVLLRFGQWQKIQYLPDFKSDEDEPLVVPLLHYARGLADITRSDFVHAKREVATLALMPVSDVDASPGDHQSTRIMLKFMRVLLNANLSYAQGKPRDAEQFLREAIGIQDAFVYAEPLDWYANARESLGMLLSETGKCSEALAIFDQDIKLQPRTPFGFYGKLLWSKTCPTSNPGAIAREFNAAWKNATISPNAQMLFPASRSLQSKTR